MVRRKFDAVIVLGGGLLKDKDGWRTTRFSDIKKNSNDGTKVLGDNLRVIASYLLYKKYFKENPNFIIVASGGRGYLRKIKGAPAVAEILKKELVALGIPENKILQEKKSNSTYQQLNIISGLMAGKKWQRVGLTSSNYHIPRIKALIQNIGSLKFLNKQLRAKKLFLISAEKILLKYDKKRWENVIARAQKSDWMKERLYLEKQGVKQLKAGFYKLR